MERPFRAFVGIDWATETHQIHVQAAEGNALGERAVPHSGIGLADLVSWLREIGEPSEIAVAIEVPHGAVVETLLEQGFAVFAINPKQLDRFRDRFTAAGAKDDRRDALVIGDSLRTDAQAFRQVRLDAPIVIQLREWSRVDEDLGVELARVTNQLRDLVYRIAPGLLALCPAADEPWFWTLLREAPTPAEYPRMSLRRLERLLREHRIRRFTASHVQTILQQRPVYTAPGVLEAVAAHIRLVLPRVELIAAQRRDAERGQAYEPEEEECGPAGERAVGPQFQAK